MTPEKRRKFKPLPPVQLLRELFSYDRDTGQLIRKKPGRKIRVGQIAGTKTSNGYLVMTIKCSRYSVHRVVYAMNHGVDPEESDIDHIDGDRMNNMIENLRLSSRSQNLANGPSRKNSSTDYRGVCLFKATGKFVAYITLNRVRRHLGYFDSPEKAALAYDRAAIESFGEFARPNFPQERRA